MLQKLKEEHIREKEVFISRVTKQTWRKKSNRVFVKSHHAHLQSLRRKTSH